MAVKILDHETGFCNQHADIPTSSSAYTFMFWFRLDSSIAVTRRLYQLQHDVTLGTPDTDDWTSASWIVQQENTKLYVYVYNKTLEDVPAFPGWGLDTGITLAVGAWHHVAVVAHAHQHRVYVDGLYRGTLWRNIGAMPTLIYEILGSDTGETSQVTFDDLRQWNAALTRSEIRAELNSTSLVRTANVFRALTLETISGTDASGAGHNLTVVNSGDMSVVSGPTLPITFAADTWVDIANGFPVPVTGSRFAGGAGRVRCELWTRDTLVEAWARLYNSTSSLVSGTSAVVQSTVPLETIFTVAVPATGVTTMRLQVTSDPPNFDIFCKGSGLQP